MKLSIITICLNNLEELKRTVASVLQQTCKEFEYIIIDGGSTDGCKEYIEGLAGVSQWISEPDKGIYNAMNKGIRIAGGEYVLFLNSGDELYNDGVLAEALPLLKGEDFYVGHSMLNRNGKSTLRKTPQQMSVRFLLEDSIMHQATFTRSALLKERPYNEQHKIVSDWEYFLQEWVLHNRSYVPLDIVISTFYLGGISSNEKSARLNDAERKEVIDALLPPRVQAEICNHDAYYLFDEKLEKKIQKALSLPPIQRDIKLLRNAFKFMWKDIWRACRKSS